VTDDLGHMEKESVVLVVLASTDTVGLSKNVRIRLRAIVVIARHSVLNRP
jgi:hypothetical protein